MFLDFFHNINFQHPEALYALLLLPLILYICHINLDSIRRKSLFRDFNQKSLKFLYSSKINLLVINLLRAAFATLLIIAIAGPRWNYHDIEVKRGVVNNLILLDVSRSMNAIDSQPNRFAHAKREIARILEPGNNYGLVAFARTSYNLIPITSDHNYIKDYLHNLKLENFSSEGSNFNFSLELILKIHNITPLNQVFIISDFDFDETINSEKLDLITGAKIKLYPVNVATNKGSPIQTTNGDFLNHNGRIVISKPRIELINLLDESREQITKDIVKSSSKLTTLRIWQERYYLFLLPLLIIFLILNKRSAFLIITFVITSNFLPGAADANPLLNKNQNAQAKYHEELYDEAQILFTDNYNKGVAAYRAKNYQEAIDYFGQNGDLNSKFNLANSLLLNEQTEDAIKQYQEILIDNPTHEKTLQNLEIARHIEKQDQDQDQDQDQEKKNDEKQDKSKPKDEQEKDNQQKKEKEASSTPQIKKQDKNLTSNIEKMGNNALSNQINKSKQKGHSNVSNPW